NTEQVYTIPPAQAVIAAYEQARANWNTWDYKAPADHPRLRYGASGKTVFCDQFCAMLDKEQELVVVEVWKETGFSTGLVEIVQGGKIGTRALRIAFKDTYGDYTLDGSRCSIYES
ncbi:MAG: hypothetical protein ACYTGS_12190, partial [Planctomycetota bacterium]